MDEPRIINTYDQNVAAGGKRVYIMRYTRSGYRDVIPSNWNVNLMINGVKYKTAPDAPWYDYGCKTFSFSGRKNAADQLLAAIAWANETYGPREFVRNRMGDYVEKEVNEKYPLPKRERRKKEA